MNNNYRSDIDGLRAIAVSLVVAYHTLPNEFPGGFIGVDIFFVISGYLITKMIIENLDKNKFSFEIFYLRRLRRLLPALLLVIFFIFILSIFTLMAHQLKDLGKHIISGITFTSNLLLWSEVGYFDTDSKFKPLRHLWSLGVEEQYFLVWPIVVFAIVKFARQYLTFFFLLFFLLSLISCIILSVLSPEAAYYLMPTRFWELMLGGILAIIQISRLNNVVQSNFSIIGIFFLIISTFFVNSSLNYPGWYALIPTIASAMILCSPQSFLNRKILSCQLMVGIGLVSYPWYLWHWPLLSIWDNIYIYFEFNSFDVKLVRIIIAIISLGLSILTYKYLEKPIRVAIPLDQKSSERKKQAWMMTIITCLIPVSIGLLTLVFNGFPERHDTRSNGIYETNLTEELSQDKFSQQFAKMEPCDIRFKVLSNSWCHQVIQFDNTKKETIVIGDSHARSLFPGLTDIWTEGSIFLSARCAPLIKVVIEDQPECEVSNQKLLTRILADNDIETVILASRGPLYTSEIGYGPIESGIGKRLYVDNNRINVSPEEKFFFGLKNFIEPLVKGSKRVIFVTNVPELGFSPMNCIATPPFVNHAVFQSQLCGISKHLVLQRQKEYRKVIRKLEKDIPSIHVYDTLNLFCDKEWCFAEQNKKLLYIDNNHLSISGSKLVGKDLNNFINKILGDVSFN